MQNDKKKQNIELTELFMAQADNERCFYGIIKRSMDEFGNPFVFSRIRMPDGLICSRAPEQKELGRNLDEICRLILDMELHKNKGVTVKLFDNDYQLN